MNIFKISIFQLNDKTFLATYTHPVLKRKLRHPFPSERDALAFKARTEKRFRRENLRDCASSIEALLCFFIKDRPKSAFAKERNSHLIDFAETFGTYQVEEITTNMLHTWPKQVQKENELQEYSLEGLRVCVSSFFYYLQKKKVLEKSPVPESYCKGDPRPLEKRNLLTEEEIDSLLKKIKHYSPGYLYPIIKVLSETAPRVFEMGDIIWDDIDLKEGTVILGARTNSNYRRLKLSPELLKILSKENRKSKRVFMTYFNQPFTPQRLTYALKEFKQKMGYKKEFSPIDLRDSFAVNFLKKGGHIKELQYILGHSNVFVTKKIYGKVATEIMNLRPSPFSLDN